jgi:NADPH:quinone reductase-like Zn-dependent oxidoreductase
MAAPRGMSPEESACIPLTYITAWNMLVERARLQSGEVVLIQSAGSGVGAAAIQIAKALGATVIATASSSEKLARASEWGADSVVNYDNNDEVVAHVKRVTSRAMVDVVFEHVGLKTFGTSMACLKRGGRIVTCGATSGADISLDLRVLFHRRISLLGATLGPKSALFSVVELLERRRLRPAVGRVLPLAKASEAHRFLESRQAFGKVVLVV